MTTNKINTIEMTRRIRDALYEQVKDKTLAERLAFYHDKAQVFHHQMGLKDPRTSSTESNSIRALIVDEEDQ